MRAESNLNVLALITSIQKMLNVIISSVIVTLHCTDSVDLVRV